MTATKLRDLFDEADFIEMLASGYVSDTKHPVLDLVIYNYTPAAQYERVWNDVTTQCRGLIADFDGNIVARPFAKFFNYGEVDTYTDLPNGDPLVSEKMDGSLGIIYSYGEEWDAVATRGSFASEQALWASKHLAETYPDFAQPTGVTTLVEIIYPANRIVVDYKDAEGLWLLGAIDNETGADIMFDDITWWTGPRTPTFPFWDLEKSVRAVGGTGFDDGEGVVLCWPRSDGPSYRLKIKSENYVRLHRIVTGLSTRTVHEALSNGTFADLIDNVPDEFHPWIRQVADDLVGQHDEILKTAKDDLFMAELRAVLALPVGQMYTRKDLAEQIIAHATHPGLCFSLKDGKNIDSKIWDMIRPERQTAMILEDAE